MTEASAAKRKGKVRRHTDAASLVNACLANAMRAFHSKHKKFPSAQETIIGHVTVKPSGLFKRDSVGNVSGCFVFETCFEDESRQMSYCEDIEVCGEFPAID
jgi:hypothetical protein